MNQKNVKGIILAAGKGTRMAPFSSRYPKPLLPICNKPLLHYQIESMRNIGIEEIIIVIGHLGYEIAQTFGDGRQYGVALKYIEQRETLGIAHAVGKLEPHISSPIFLFLGDIFFVTEDLSSMREIMLEREASAVLAVKHEKDAEAIKKNFAIRLDDKGLVKRVVEKPRHLTNSLKGCGLYLFDQQVFDAIRRTPRTAMRDEYEITDTIQIMVDDGLPIHISPVVRWDMNVTVPGDVLACNLHQLQRLGEKNLIGDSAQIHPGAEITNSVVGKGAVIQYPIHISNSVIFPNTLVATGHDVEQFIMTPEHQIDCRQFNAEEWNGTL